MTENVLYLKYRPQTLDEIVGNKETIQILRSQLDGQTPMPKTLLFHGPTGVGKTSIARIVANELGATGSGVREIDFADLRGIDSVREIKKQSSFKPLEGKCQVWILDEIHRATGDAMSALLKILEDTPAHVYFILCTTDPQKLLATIKGRCAQYKMDPLNDKEMKILLRRVVTAENDSLPKEVYEQIIMDSLGQPRDALQILAQVLAVEEEARLGVAKRTAELHSATIELCRALVDGSPWKKISGILKGLQQEDAERIRRAILGYCQAILLNGQNDQAAAVMEEMRENLYSSGWPGLVLACYSVIFSNGE